MTDQTLTARDLFAAVAAHVMCTVMHEVINEADKVGIDMLSETAKYGETIPKTAFAFADKMMAERAMTQPGLEKINATKG